MSAKHTPGPWIFDGDYIWSEPAKCYVADPQTEDMLIGQACAKQDIYKQIQANARLIAAAPDLLDALQVLLNATMHKNHPAESDMAIAAIAKAKGKS